MDAGKLLRTNKQNNQMKKLSFIIFLLTVFLSLTAQSKRPNVLFIAVDDLRPELSCFGQGSIISPNIDKLAEEGLLFTRAYCNIPVCGASRSSLMSGIRPNRNRFTSARSRVERDVPGTTTLPMHFKNNGYTTISIGKLFDYDYDTPGSWNEIRGYPQGDWYGRWQAYVTEESVAQFEGDYERGRFRGPSFEAADGPDHTYVDGLIAEEAIFKLNELSQKGEPFFLGVGFLKPHLPFNAPKKYWDLYDFDNIELPDNMHQPKDAPDESMHNFGELRGYVDVPREGPIDEEFMRKLIHGYYACVSYSDAQVGKLLNELKELGLEDNTIVILWGDHGWHLGEHNLWCKHCNFEKVLHVPLILKIPGRGNMTSDALVELIDIYPSLCEAAGLPLPFHLQGRSFVPLTENPDQPWKSEVYSRWTGGETVITQEYSYTEWHDEETGNITARMMYDLVNDPEENVNISERKENRDLIRELSEKLKNHMADRDRIVLPLSN
jgi:arylsulfatase A-like enzyme